MGQIPKPLTKRLPSPISPPYPACYHPSLRLLLVSAVYVLYFVTPRLTAFAVGAAFSSIARFALI